MRIWKDPKESMAVGRQLLLVRCERTIHIFIDAMMRFVRSVIVNEERFLVVYSLLHTWVQPPGEIQLDA